MSQGNQQKPARRLTQTGLASMRSKRLRRQLDRKHPLLADLLEETEHRASPDYFAGKRLTKRP